MLLPLQCIHENCTDIGIILQSESRAAVIAELFSFYKYLITMVFPKEQTNNFEGIQT